MHVKSILPGLVLASYFMLANSSPIPQFLGVPNFLLDPALNPRLIVGPDGRIIVDPRDVPRLIDGAIDNQIDRVNRQIDNQRGTPGGGGLADPNAQTPRFPVGGSRPGQPEFSDGIRDPPIFGNPATNPRQGLPGFADGITTPSNPSPVVRPAPNPVVRPAPNPAARPAPNPAARPATGPANRPAPGPANRPAPGPANRPAPGAANRATPGAAPRPAAPRPAAPRPAAPRPAAGKGAKRLI